MSFYITLNQLPSPGAAGNLLVSTGLAWSSSASAVPTSPAFTTVSASQAVSAGVAYAVNTSAGAVTLTLPAAPATSTTIQFQDAGGTWGTNNLTVDPNGKSIMGLFESMICRQSSQGFGLIYNGADWRIF
jgi:hypothetical protein